MGMVGAASHAGFDAVENDTITEVLTLATGALAAAGLSYVVIGGLASRALGRPRCSSDIDLFVKPDDARAVLAVLAERGFATEEVNPYWLFKATRDGVLVDVLFKTKGDIYVDDEMLARAVSRSFRGRPVKIVPPEDLIVIKALVHDEETSRHWFDALAVLAASDLDWDYLVRRARKGPARVLSLLCYAVSNGLVVPPRALARMVALAFGDRDGGCTHE